jgi:deoxycytidylate deaminase
MNCILYAETKYENSILYSTLSPCKDCIKIIAAANITKVIYLEEYKDLEISKSLCESFSIELIKFT